MNNKINILQNLFIRQQPNQSYFMIVKAGLGAVIAIALLALLSRWTDSFWLMAPFGATCVLLFSVPTSPLSQPINVIAGHFISSSIGLSLHVFFLASWWSIALGVGLSIAVMASLRVTHPPAGADPLVIFIENPGWDYLGFPVVSGSIILVLVAWIIHRIPPVITYPNK